ncbi:hypothetical protein [Deinococcus multiflagellatus]|uniref:Uncharacterized protein n=1 Tax=Deinococcus multiflagellatus TaxID=1656887 RepID=A0ABW1ZIU3_9DEIO
MPLRLNEWTVLYRLQVDPQADPNTISLPASNLSAKARGVYVAVLPLNRTPGGDGGTAGAGDSFS